MRAPRELVRLPAVAGSFYPERPDQLEQAVEALLASVAVVAGVRPKALVVPHAGYIYSGSIAASAYNLLRQSRPLPTRVVLLGPSHYAAFHGLRLPGVDALRTPLGDVPVDGVLASKTRAFAFVADDARAHAKEHSLEVQLPFLQRVLGQFTVLPLVVGQATPSEVAQVLDAVWGGPETLLVVSTDLSHFLSAAQASVVDRHTAQLVLAGEASLSGEQACGAAPLNGLLFAARAHGLEVRLLDLRHSGDTAGEASRVVGYGAFVLTGEGE